MQRVRPALCAVAASGLVAAVMPATAAASFAGKPGRLVFDALKGDHYLLWDYAPRTAMLRQLTRPVVSCKSHTDAPDDSWGDFSPDYSPGGRRIAYLHSDNCPGWESRVGLWVIGADGSSGRMVAPFGDFSGQSAAFSPDGQRLAVVGRNPGASALVQLVFDAQTGTLLSGYGWGVNQLPSPGSIDWGSNGRLAIGTGRGIYALRAEGGIRRRLSFPAQGDPLARWVAVDQEPDWSPTEPRIAFARTEQRGIDEGASADVAQVALRYSIRTIATGKRRAARRLVRSEDPLYSPVFSPDGRSLAFFSRDDLKVIPAQGGQSRVLVRGKPFTGALDWQPRQER